MCYLKDGVKSPEDCEFNCDCDNCGLLYEQQCNEIYCEVEGEFNDETPTKETTQAVYGFKGKSQTPLFMITKLYYENNEIVWGEVLFSTGDFDIYLRKSLSFFKSLLGIKS